MAFEVTDRSSNLNDQLANAAKVLGRSRDRRAVFAAIYNGKRRIKTQDDLRGATKLSNVRLLQESGRLVANQLVDPVKVNGRTAFKKIPFYSSHKGTILRLATDKKKLERLPTKVNPVGRPPTPIVARYFAKAQDVVPLTVDDIDSFSNVRKVTAARGDARVDERLFKEGIKRIVGETGKFVDWGGEKNDLFTTKVRIRGRRVASVFAFKGKGKKGVLKPKDFGKNGDQILRLFQTDADAFFVQYCGQLDQSVYELMRSLAVAKSAVNGQRIFFGVIDGDDTRRLLQAYSAKFRRPSRRRVHA